MKLIYQYDLTLENQLIKINARSQFAGAHFSWFNLLEKNIHSLLKPAILSSITK
jgi:hypothetical protein